MLALEFCELALSLDLRRSPLSPSEMQSKIFRKHRGGSKSQINQGVCETGI